MSDAKRMLERTGDRFEMPEPAMDRLLRRRERRERHERIAAATVGLSVAAIAIVGAVVTLRVAGPTSPASGEEAAVAAEGSGVVLPTIAIWTAIFVLGLTVFAAVRLRARSAPVTEDRGERGERDDAAPSARRRARIPTAHRARGASEMDSKPKAGLGLAGSEVSAIRFDDGRLHRTNRWLIAAVVILALAVVALGAALIAAADEGTTPTPPAAAGAPAVVPYLTGPVAEAEVVFDGTRCSYAGPTEMAAGTSGVLRFKGPKGSGLTLARLAPGISWEDVERSETEYTPGNPPPWVTGAMNQIGSGTLNGGVLDEGLYAVGCATGPTIRDQMFFSVMLRVIGP